MGRNACSFINLISSFQNKRYIDIFSEPQKLPDQSLKLIIRKNEIFKKRESKELRCLTISYKLSFLILKKYG